MKEAAIKEKADLEKRIDELEKQKNLEKDELKERIAELEKQKIDEKKEKDYILDYLEREVTCPVCLMIPRTKKIPICKNGHTTCETCKR
jgi:acetyl-CoA carboxylase alpha subunit